MFSMVVVLFEVQRRSGQQEIAGALGALPASVKICRRATDFYFSFALAFDPFAGALSTCPWPWLVYRATQESREL